MILIASKFKKLLFISLVLFQVFTLSAESADSKEKKAELTDKNIQSKPADDSLQLALSNPDYPVVPGDLYQLNFFGVKELISQEILVEPDFNISLGFLGRMDAREKKFSELKALIEAKVAASYPSSNPSLKLKSLGKFQIIIRGYIEKPGLLTTWGLTRLEDILKDQLTPFSSIRQVEIRNGNAVKFIDFSLWKMGGNLVGNPIIRPNDEVIISRAKRMVDLQGSVVRPGIYELKDGDTFEEVINFGLGMKKTADTRSIKIDRVIGSSDGRPESIIFDATKRSLSSLQLFDLDSIQIPDQNSILPILFIEGAVGQTRKADEVKDTPQVTGNLNVSFYAGESLWSIVQRSKEAFFETADLKSASLYQVKSAQVRPVDLTKYLYGLSPVKDDIVLEPNDRLIVPFRQFFVTVSGAVSNPGRYPYVPDRSYRYYVDLAGGFDDARNIGGSVDISDISDLKVDLKRIIQPEDKIYAPSNSPYFFMGQITPFITFATAVLTFSTTIITLMK